MAYQNVSRCRFFVDELQWLKAIGFPVSAIGTNLVSGNKDSIIGLDNGDVSTWNLTADTANNHRVNRINLGISLDKVFQNGTDGDQYYAILGHNLSGVTLKIDNHQNGYDHWTNNREVVNYSYLSHGTALEYDGFSIGLLRNTNDASVNAIRWGVYGGSGEYKIRTVSIGNVYDMPHSPDLSLKLSYEYDGIKTQQTKGGATLSNALYTKPADWGDMGAWQLGTEQVPDNFRSGRRVWDLSFSYLSDLDVFPLNASSGYAATIGSESGYPEGSIVQVSGAGTATTTDDSYEFTSNILEGTDFFSQVWNKTIGGHLPFIFQPDSTNSNSDQFAICRFDMNSLQLNQIGHNLYNMQIRIRESW